MQSLIFVLGMHRSGTSLLARTINLLGASIPGNVLAATVDNPQGYWEPKELVSLNNATLKDLERPWYDERALDPTSIADELPLFLDQAVPMLQRWFALNDILVLKDPRLSRLLPLWVEATHRLGIDIHALLILRNPLEVAESLRRRWEDQASRPAAVIQHERSLLLWLRYVLEAEQHSREIRRAFLTYEALLDNPVHCLQCCINTLAVTLPRTLGETGSELRNLVDHSLRRSRSKSPPAPEYRIAMELYQAVQQCSGFDLDDAARQRFAVQSQVFTKVSERFDKVREVVPPANQVDPWSPRMLRAMANSSNAGDFRTPNGILFITGAPLSKGHIYRVQNRLEALRENGIHTTVRPFDSPDLLSAARGAGLVLIYRCEWSDGLSGLYRYCRRAGIPLGFDIDDLVFDPAYMTPRYFDFLRRSDVSAHAWHEKAKRYQWALKEADFAMLTTETLRRSAQRFLNRCFLLPNGLSQERLDTARQIPERTGEEALRIGYASGTPTHQRDFRQIIEPLCAILKAHPRVILTILGHLDLHEFPDIAACSDRIEQRAVVSFERLPHELACFDINLAPLEIGNPFCEAKSELKYFEAGLVGVPTIASATAPMRAAILPGATGYCCASLPEWRQHLETLIRDPAQRKTIARRAHFHALAEYGPAAQRDAFLAVLADVLQAYPRKGRVRTLLARLRKALS